MGVACCSSFGAQSRDHVILFTCTVDVGTAGYSWLGGGPYLYVRKEGCCVKLSVVWVANLNPHLILVSLGSPGLV